LSKVDGKYYATSFKCSHFGLDLSYGVLFEDRVVCPFHLASFSVKTGEHEHGPVFKGLQTFPVEVKDGKVYVKVDKSVLA
jgi:nitrite reductase/ring-hydroxylating ferredoxin subunit